MNEHRREQLRALWRRSGLERIGALDRVAAAGFHELERWRSAVTLSADLASYRTLRRLDGRGRPLRAATVRVRVRPLGGHEIELRPGTSDTQMLRETFRDGVHLPPGAIEARGVHTIVDLGANIGITVADNALRHPQARILAVELDPENAELARRNTERWSDRCEVLQAAVWTHDGEVPYERERGNEYGFSVLGEHAQSGPTTRALSPAKILAHLPAEARIDFLKMDVEGVESRILYGDAAAWVERIDSIALQVHGEYTLERCAGELTALGFRAAVDPRRHDFITGVRD